jgi:hypothetical protein
MSISLVNYWSKSAARFDLEGQPRCRLAPIGIVLASGGGIAYLSFIEMPTMCLQICFLKNAGQLHSPCIHLFRSSGMVVVHTLNITLLYSFLSLFYPLIRLGPQF